MNIFLYINGQMADFNEASLVLLNYAVTDLDNPTIVRNSYTQAVTLPPTPRNNAIFANIQRSDFTRGHGFDPIERTPFELRNERNEVLKAGYLKLDKFKKGGDYSVTLYGGLGEFFYSLMYNADGSKKTLADMAWYTENGDPGYINPKTHGLRGSAVNAIAAAWEWLAGGCIPSDDAPEGCDCFNFALTLEGKPGDFDAKKGYYKGGRTGLYKNKNKDGKAYGPQSGCEGIIVDLAGEDHTSEEAQDINTQNIRNVWSVRAFFHSICNPAHNGGYAVELDPGFFNDDNAQYMRGWVTSGKGYGTAFADALTGTKSPADYLLGFAKMFGLRFIVDEAAKAVTIMHRRDFYRDGAESMNWNQHIDWDGFCTDQGWSRATCVRNDDGSATLSFPDGGRWVSVARPTVPVRHHCMLTVEYEGDSGFALYAYNADASLLQSLYFPVHTTRTIVRQEVDIENLWNYGLEIELYNGTGNLRIYGFNLVDLTQVYGNMWDGRRTVEGYYSDGDGVFYPAPGTGERATSNAIPVAAGKRYRINKAAVNAMLEYDTAMQFRGARYIGWDYYTPAPGAAFINLDQVDYGDTVTLAPTPEEFGAAFPGTSYPFNPEGQMVYTIPLLDLSAVLDLNTAPEITPLLMSERYEDMQVDMVGENATAYAEKYGRPYGRKRLDTSYKFDADKNKILTDGIALKGACDVLESSPWFFEFGDQDTYDHDEHQYRDYLCKFARGGATWKLYNYDGGEESTLECTMDLADYHAHYRQIDGGRYFSPFVQIHGADNAAADGQNIAIFYAGDCAPRFGSLDDFLYEMWLTETSADMLAANGGKACWNISRAEDSQHILLSHLPVFRRNVVSGGAYTHSWDFAPSAEIYVPDENQGGDGVFLYDVYWGYLADYYDADTRKMRCRVNLRRLGLPVDASLLRRFWAWDGAVWVLSKISNHSLTTDDLTDCEFIRVKDIDNYTR